MSLLTSLALPLQLLTGALGTVVIVFAGHAIRQGRVRRARLAIGFGLGWGMLYVGAVIGVSLTSTRQELSPGEYKRFCGFYLDCHAIMTVRDVRTAITIGMDADAVRAEGIFYIVTVEQASDAARARIGLADPGAIVLDATGRRYAPSATGTAALAAATGPRPRLGTALAPGRTIQTQIVFDLPPGIERPVLHIAERNWMSRLSELLLIGDEDSLLHPPTVFRLTG